LIFYRNHLKNDYYYKIEIMAVQCKTTCLRSSIKISIAL